MLCAYFDFWNMKLLITSLQFLLLWNISFLPNNKICAFDIAHSRISDTCTNYYTCRSKSKSKSRSRFITPMSMSMSKKRNSEIPVVRRHNNNKINNKRYNRMAIFTDNDILMNMYSITGILSICSWVYTSFVALSYHPDPKFISCTLRHNVLTMTQAFAFPLPIAFASFRVLQVLAKHNKLDSDYRIYTENISSGIIGRRINIGIALASVWLAGATSVTWAPKFAFGYDLYSTRHKIISSFIHTFTALFSLGVAFLCTKSSFGELIRGTVDSLWKLGPSTNKESLHRNSGLYAIGSVGLFWFTVLPIVSPYPLTTIPTILGKRLSRPASAFTLQGAIIAHCLKDRSTCSHHLALNDHNKGNIEDSSVKLPPSLSSKEEDKLMMSTRKILRNGLARGSGSHILLLFLKLIGVDGGGWIIPGNGLQEVYPAMISVPFSTGASLAVHVILCYAACSDDEIC